MSYNVVFIFSENNSYLGKFEMYVFFLESPLKTSVKRSGLVVGAGDR